MKRGFLLMNTGSPDAPTESALRTYLGQFLMDPYVIDLPFPIRYAIVHWAILPKRPAQSAEAYNSIWTENGSPLIHYCTSLTAALKERLDEPLEMIMAYGNPSVSHGVGRLLDAGVDEVCLLPMFPQYAMATVGSCVAGVRKELKRRSCPATLRVVPPFYSDPTYIEPIAESLKDVNEHILFSYHGLPVRHLKKTDPTGSHCMSTATCCTEPSIAHDTCYRHQCYSTTRAIAEIAGMAPDRYHISFQSRLGRAQWMEPYTDQTLRALPSKGITELAVVCPAFFCDCLETLEEIEIQGRETFMEAGGNSFRMIPCLNDSGAAIDCMESLIRRSDSWPIA
ncbi:MAG: ferrochelatase [Pontiellaceae bacterium]|nr:ferrochelatase [Pontiellaceae bacterium]MBN2785914.1 ferrochelatase [Pontiellaceae bacterium]